MSSHSAPAAITKSSGQLKEAEKRLHEPWLMLVRVLWLAVALLSIGLFIVSIPQHAQHLHVICSNALCGRSENASQLTRELRSLGLTLDFYAAYSLSLQIIFALGYFTIAMVIFWRKSDDWMALLVSLFLITFVLAYADVPHELSRSNAFLGLLAAYAGFIGEMTFPLCLYLFPDGRFAPRWIGWLLIGWAAWGILIYFFPGSPIISSTWFLWLEGLAFVSGLGSMIIAQVYRYQHLSTPAQRQQTKWVVFGITIALVGFFGAGFLGFILPRALFLVVPQSGLFTASLIGIAAITISYLAMLLIPFSLVMAIQRSRLWEIDLIVNRTLVYGTLTGTLAFVSFGGVVFLQYLLGGLSRQGKGSELAIIGTTLAIVALFQPLKRRIQTVIDRRFYRRRYDVTLMLEAFSVTLREEVDLNTLTEKLVAVVDEAMQPAYISLWLRNSEQSGERRTRLLAHAEESITNYDMQHYWLNEGKPLDDARISHLP
jgi:hypothetical protein